MSTIITLTFKDTNATIQVDLHADTPSEFPQVATLTTNVALSQAQVLAALEHLQANTVRTWGQHNEAIVLIEKKIADTAHTLEALEKLKKATNFGSRIYAGQRIALVKDINILNTRLNQYAQELAPPQRTADALLEEYVDLEFVIQSLQKSKSYLDEQLVPFKSYTISLDPELDAWVNTYAKQC